jgi:hypothetical protein
MVTWPFAHSGMDKDPGRGNGLKDTGKTRSCVKASAVSITGEVENGDLNNLEWHPDSHKSYFLEPKRAPKTWN